MISPQAKSMYPRCAALKLQFVQSPSGSNNEMPGFDDEEVLRALGQTRYNALMAYVATASGVFVCGHRNYGKSPATGKPAGTEVHCIFAKDLEMFLGAGG